MYMCSFIYIYIYVYIFLYMYNYIDIYPYGNKSFLEGGFPEGGVFVPYDDPTPKLWSFWGHF